MSGIMEPVNVQLLGYARHSHVLVKPSELVAGGISIYGADGEWIADVGPNAVFKIEPVAVPDGPRRAMERPNETA